MNNYCVVYDKETNAYIILRYVKRGIPYIDFGSDEDGARFFMNALNKLSD